MIVSSACWQRRAGIQPRRPTACCEPDSAGSQYKDPEKDRTITTHNATRRAFVILDQCLLHRNYATFNLKRTQLAIFNTLLSLYQAPLQLIGEYLNVLSERIEDLFRYCQRSGEVQLSVLVDDIFSRVIPVEITYGFLETKTFCIVSVQY